MTANQLLNAYNDYTVSMDEYESAHPFDLMTAMGRPQPPAQSIAAQAGELIAEKGNLARALAVALTDAMSRELPDDKRAMYMELIVAAVE